MRTAENAFGTPCAAGITRWVKHLTWCVVVYLWAKFGCGFRTRPYLHLRGFFSQRDKFLANFLQVWCLLFFSACYVAVKKLDFQLIFDILAVRKIHPSVNRAQGVWRPTQLRRLSPKWWHVKHVLETCMEKEQRVLQKQGATFFAFCFLSSLVLGGITAARTKGNPHRREPLNQRPKRPETSKPLQPSLIPLNWAMVFFAQSIRPRRLLRRAVFQKWTSFFIAQTEN